MGSASDTRLSPTVSVQRAQAPSESILTIINASYIVATASASYLVI